VTPDATAQRPSLQAELDALWDFTDPAASEQRFRAARDEPGTDAVRAGTLTTQLARALGLQDRFDEADALLDGVDGDPLVAVRRDLERGRLRRSAGRVPEAVPLFGRAADGAAALATDPGPDPDGEVRVAATFLRVDALHMLALSDDGAADRWTREALAALEPVTDARTLRWRVALHNNRGWERHDAGEYDAALAEFRAALDAAVSYGNEAQRIAARWSVARCLRSLGRTADALAMQEALAADAPDDPYVAEELAILRGGAAG